MQRANSFFTKKRIKASSWYFLFVIRCSYLLLRILSIYSYLNQLIWTTKFRDEYFNDHRTPQVTNLDTSWDKKISHEGLPFTSPRIIKTYPSPKGGK